MFLLFLVLIYHQRALYIYIKSQHEYTVAAPLFESLNRVRVSAQKLIEGLLEQESGEL